MLQVFVNFSVRAGETQPASTDRGESSNIDVEARGEKTSDIYSFVFDTVSRESFAAFSQECSSRMVVRLIG